MEKKVDVTALGELLIDFTEGGLSANGMRLFEQNPGGAVANVLAALAKFDRKTAFIGKVGQDMHGIFLKETLQNAGIDCCGLVMAADVFTTLAFVALSPSGEREFSFARKPGADTCLAAEEVDAELLRSTKILHVGSLSLTDEPARSATFHAVRTAKEAGAIISYDPNYRASLWKDPETASKQMRSLLPLVDVIKISDEETELLTGVSSPEDAAKKLNELGIACAAVTLGSEGALISVSGEMTRVPGYPAKVVDTTGAGDSFWGGFLHKLLESGKHPKELTLAEAAEFADWGNATASLCVRKRGAIPAMPEKAAVEALLAEK